MRHRSDIIMHDRYAIAPLVLPLLGFGASALSGLFGGRGKTQTTTSTLDPTLGPLQSQVLQMITKRLSNGGLPPGYEASQIGDINHVYDLVGQRSTNDLTSRGLGTSPVAGVVDANNQQARGGSIADLVRSLPMVARNFQNQDLGLASTLLGQGRGTTTTQSGNMAGGAFDELGTMLGFLIATGKLGAGGGTPQLPGTPVPLPRY